MVTVGILDIENLKTVNYLKCNSNQFNNKFTKH